MANFPAKSLAKAQFPRHGADMKKIAVLALAALGSILPLVPGRGAEPVDPAADPNAVSPDEDAPKTGPQQLFSTESGSFEWPPVIARKTLGEGADVTKSAMNAEWHSIK